MKLLYSAVEIFKNNRSESGRLKTSRSCRSRSGTLVRRVKRPLVASHSERTFSFVNYFPSLCVTADLMGVGGETYFDLNPDLSYRQYTNECRVCRYGELLWRRTCYKRVVFPTLIRYTSFSFKNFMGDFFSYYIQHCFICRPSESSVPTDAGIEPWTVATGALAVRRANH